MADPKAVTDSVIVGGLVTSPAWASWLGDLNQLLTTATLVIGLALGIGRLVMFFRQRQE